MLNLEGSVRGAETDVMPNNLLRAPIMAAALAAVVIETATALAQSPPVATPVTVSRPIAKRITQWDEYWGRFVAVHTVEVRPRVSGFIEKIHFTDGQIVEAGDLLFTIEQRSFQIAVHSARAEVARAESQVTLQQSEVERAAPLARTGALTQRELETRKANLLGAQAQLQAAQAARNSTELNLEWTEVRAPIGGRISDRKVDAGNLVNGGTAGAVLLATIVSLDPIHFIFDAPEADYLHYTRAARAGERQSGREVKHPVRVRLADDTDWKRTGRLDFVDNQLNARSGTIRGRAIFDNKDQLLTPGLFARLQLFGGDSDALLVPDMAVVSDQASKIVFIVDSQDIVRARKVQLGILSDGLRVIRDGLQREDRVVLDGLANPAVRPDTKVSPQSAEIQAVSSN
jgi:membrane fusion protein, multidrug efflux system